MLGEALLDQKKFADAEPLLLSGYEGMKQREDTIPPQDKPRLTKALERLVKLYEAWGKKDEAMKWRKELAAGGRRRRGNPDRSPTGSPSIGVARDHRAAGRAPNNPARISKVAIIRTDRSRSINPRSGHVGAADTVIGTASS